MKFYTLDGNEIDRTVFVEKYGPSYYIDRPRYIPRVGQSSRPIEDYMDELLKNGVKEPLDVVRILAWKLGKIKHSESKKPGEAVAVTELPWKNSHAFERVFDTHMVPFMEQLESVFGTVYQECRDVDRALWVYGHAFRVNR